MKRGIAAVLLCLLLCGCVPQEKVPTTESTDAETAAGTEKTQDVMATELPTAETTVPATEPAEETIVPVTESTEVTTLPTEQATQPEERYLIVIDAGHQAVGNRDKEPVGPGAAEMKTKVASGTSGCVSGWDEYELNLTVALKLQEELESRGYEVLMIRTTHDVNISNAERAQYANAVGADAYIRIHGNGSEDPAVHGGLAVCQTEKNPYQPQNYERCRLLADKVIESYCAATGCKNRGVWETDTMTGINWCEVPNCIVELGFMSCPEEDALMATESYQTRMVQGIADGLDAYFSAISGQ